MYFRAAPRREIAFDLARARLIRDDRSRSGERASLGFERLADRFKARIQRCVLAESACLPASIDAR